MPYDLPLKKQPFPAINTSTDRKHFSYTFGKTCRQDAAFEQLWSSKFLLP